MHVLAVPWFLEALEFQCQTWSEPVLHTHPENIDSNKLSYQPLITATPQYITVTTYSKRQLTHALSTSPVLASSPSFCVLYCNASAPFGISGTVFVGQMSFQSPNQPVKALKVTTIFTPASLSSVLHNFPVTFWCYIFTHTHLFNGSLSGTTQVDRYQKGKTSLNYWSTRQWVAVASAGPYANKLLLAPDREQCQHPPLSFYRPDAIPAAQPTASLC